MYEEAYLDAVADPFRPNPTDPLLAGATGRTRPLDQGLLQEAKKGAAQGAANIVDQSLATAEVAFGSERAGHILHQRELDAAYDRSNAPAPGVMNMVVNKMSQGAVEYAPQLAMQFAGAGLGSVIGNASIASRGLAASSLAATEAMRKGIAIGRNVGLATSVLTQTFGMRARELEQRMGPGSSTAAKWWALTSSALEYATEKIGVDALFAGPIDKAVGRMAARVAKSSITESTLTTAIKGMRIPGSFAARALVANAGENIEEQIALAGNALIDLMSVGDTDYGADRIIQTAIDTTLSMAIPGIAAAAFSGGRQDLRRNDIENNLKNPLTPEAQTAAYTKGAEAAVPEAVAKARADMEARVSVLQSVLSKRFGPENTEAAVTDIRTISENLAAMDSERLPQDYVDKILISIENGDFDQAAWDEANKLDDPTARHRKKVEVLKATPGFGQMVYDVTELALAKQTKAENDSREKEMFGDRSEQALSEKLSGRMQKTPPEGSFSVHAFNVIDADTYDDLYKRGSVRGVKMGGRVFTVMARGVARLPDGVRVVLPGDLVFVESSDTVPKPAAPDALPDPFTEMLRSYNLDRALDLDGKQVYNDRAQAVRSGQAQDALDLAALAKGIADLAPDEQLTLKNYETAQAAEKQAARQALVDMLAKRGVDAEAADAAQVKGHLAAMREEKAREGQTQVDKFKARQEKQRAMAVELDAKKKAVDEAPDEASKTTAIKSFEEAAERIDAEMLRKDVDNSRTRIGNFVTLERMRMKLSDAKQSEKFRQRQAKQQELLRKLEEQSVAVAEAEPEKKAEEIKSFADISDEFVAERESYEEELRTPPENARPLQLELFNRESARADGIDPQGWFSDNSTTPRAFYDPTRRAMHFFKTATADDIIHEWFHHITETTGLLPSPLRDALVRNYTTDGKWDPEAAVRGFLRYVRDRELPEGVKPELVKAFDRMRAILAGSAQANAGVFNDETLAAFDAMFGFEIDKDTLAVGQALHARAEQAVAYRSGESLAEIRGAPEEGSGELFSMSGNRAESRAAAATPEQEARFRELTKTWTEGGERTFYRGTVPGETQRIKEPFEAARGKTFVARKAESAKNYGSEIETVVASPDAKILRDEDAAFWKLVGRRRPPNGYIGSALRGSETIRDAVNDAIRKAEQAGYDIVSFSSDADIGTVILNEDAVTRKASSSNIPAAWSAWREQHPEEYAELEKMRAEVLKAQGYNVGPVWHGTDKAGLTEFYGGWWSDQKAATREFGPVAYSAYLRGPLADGDQLRALYIERNGTDVNPDSDDNYPLTDSEIADAAMSGGPFSRFVQEKGIQGIAVWDESNAVSGMAYAAFDPSQIKSASVEPDSTGRIPPPSEWGDAGNADIRFSEEPSRAAWTDADVGKFRRRLVDNYRRRAGLRGDDARDAARQIAVNLFGTKPDEKGHVITQLTPEQLLELDRVLKAVADTEMTQRLASLSREHYDGRDYQDLSEPEKQHVLAIVNADAISDAGARKLDEEAAKNKKFLLDYSKNLGSDLQEELIQAPSRGPGEMPGAGSGGVVGKSARYLEKAHYDIKKWYHGVLRGVMTHMHSFQDFCNIMARGNPNSIWIRSIAALYKKSELNLTQARLDSVAYIDVARKKHGLKRFPLSVGRPYTVAGKVMSGETMLWLASVGRGDTTKDTVTGAYANRQTEAAFTSNAHLLVGRDRAAFDTLLTEAYANVQKDKELKATLDTIDDYFAWDLDRINAARKQMGLPDARKVRGYTPLIRTGGMFADEDDFANSLDWSPSKVIARLSADARQKERVAIAGGEIRMDLLAVFNQYRQQSDQYVAKELIVEQLKRAVKTATPGFTQQGYLPEQRMMLNLLESERHYNGRYTPMDAVEMAVNAIGSRYKRSVFGLNMPSAFKQPISLLNALATLPIRDVWRAPWYLMDLTRYALMHGHAGWPNVLDGHPVWEKMKKGNSMHTQSQYVATEAAINVDPNSFWNIEVLGVPLKDGLLLPMRIGDMIGRVVAWGVAYDSKMGQLRSSSMSDAKKHQTAFDFAEENTRISQPAASNGDRAMLQKGHEAWRAFAAFQGQPIKNWNMLTTSLAPAINRAWRTGSAKGGPMMAVNEVVSLFIGTPGALKQYGLTTGAAQQMAFVYIIPALALSALARGRLPEDMDEFWGDMFAYNISMLPIIGPIISGALLFDKWQTGWSPLYANVMNDIASAVKSIRDRDGEGFERTLARTLMESTGIPVKAGQVISKFSENAYGTGITDTDWPAALKWFFFGEQED